jgi:hypothetical protein
MGTIRAGTIQAAKPAAKTRMAAPGVHTARTCSGISALEADGRQKARSSAPAEKGVNEEEAIV